MLPRVFAPDMTAGTDVITLSDDEAHHLIRVRRLGRGDIVRLFDGGGGEWEGRVESIARDRVTVAIDRAVIAVPEPPVRVTLALGLLKGDQMDIAIRDATAMGAGRIVPVASGHVAVASRGRRAAPIERWQRIAVAAAKQCGRAVVPAVTPVTTFDDLLQSSAAQVIVLAAEPEAAIEPVDLPPRPTSALALVGPEGGWTEDELHRARDRGAVTVRLGPRTLRAETTPAVLLTHLWTAWGWQ